MNSSTISRTLLLAVIAAFPASSFALDFPPSMAPDPLRLRACPVNFFGSNSSSCELLGLIGPVSRVSYSFSPKKEPDLIYQFDKSGRIAEVHQRIQDSIGGWGRRHFIYEPDGLLNSITWNEQPNSDFRYADGKLLTSVFHPDKTSCTYSFLVTDRASMEASCRNAYRSFQFRGEIDNSGKLIKLDEVGSQQLNINGPLECTWLVKGGKLSSECSNGYYLHKFQYNERMRPVEYSRTVASGKNSLFISFSYVDDNVGNWINQTIHYIETSSTNRPPSDVINTRTVEYFK
jgi:hypothetical protein